MFFSSIARALLNIAVGWTTTLFFGMFSDEQVGRECTMGCLPRITPIVFFIIVEACSCVTVAAVLEWALLKV